MKVMLGSWLENRKGSDLGKLVGLLSEPTPMSQVTDASCPKQASRTIHRMGEGKRDWKFCVRVDTLLQESVLVVGSCPDLGNWNSAGAVELTSEGYGFAL
jgi:hypothetical protein